MLRILHVAGCVSTKYGALERHFVALAEECVFRRHRPYWVFEAAPHTEEFVDDLMAAGGGLSVIPARRSPVAFLVRMVLWMKRNHVDVVHTHFNPASLLALLAARCAGVPVRLVTLHGSLSDERIARLSKRSVLLSRIGADLCTKAFAVSEHTERQYSRLGIPCEKIVRAYIGIQTGKPLRERREARRELGLSDRDIVIACIAFHDRVKGIDVLLRSVALLAGTFDRLRVLQIGGPGDPEETARLKALSEALGIQDRVVWTGCRDDARELLGAADVYCQPSRSEGLPLAVLEAMDAGLSVVAARVGGIPEVVQDGHTGILCDPESPGDLADALRVMLSDEGRRTAMGAKGREGILDRFDVTSQTKVIVDWYERLYTR